MSIRNAHHTHACLSFLPCRRYAASCSCIACMHAVIMSVAKACRLHIHTRFPSRNCLKGTASPVRPHRLLGAIVYATTSTSEHNSAPVSPSGMKLKGSCHCGAVKFEVESKTPQPFMHCYCTICRKTQGGGGYTINIMVLTSLPLQYLPKAKLYIQAYMQYCELLPIGGRSAHVLHLRYVLYL